MDNKSLEKELVRFLEEQASHLAPIPVALLQKHVNELEKYTSTTESVELLIVVTKDDADQLTQNSSDNDSETNLLLKNLLKAIVLDHKKRNIYTLDIPDLSPSSTVHGVDTLVSENAQKKFRDGFLNDIRRNRPQFIIMFNQALIPLLNDSKEHTSALVHMGEIFDVEHSQCLITHSLKDLLSNKALKRETWEHVQKIPSNF